MDGCRVENEFKEFKKFEEYLEGSRVNTCLKT